MNKISQKEYLKKYLTSDDKLEKKKKKKSKEKKVKTGKQTVKIIDDDASAFDNHDDIDESELFATNEEAPQIVGVVDERAPSVIMKQEYEQSGKWKTIDKSSSSTSKNNSNIRRKSRDESPPPRKRKDSSDVSPIRKNRRDSDASPPRKNRKDSDASPPRKNRKDSSDVSPIRKNRRDSDASPPRKNRKDSSDVSPIRKNRRDSDASPPRKNRKDSDASPPRRDSTKRRDDSRERSKYSSNRSPQRRRERDHHSKKSRWSPDIKKEPRSPPRSEKMSKTLDGKASGLQNAKSLKRENEEFRARQDKLFNDMKADVSGKNADVVIRDRRGRNREFEYDMEKEKKKMEAEEARKKVYDKWGKGLKQLEEIEKRRQEFVHEASKPLARSEDDKDLEDHLKTQERLDDPMLMYMRKKRTEEKRSKGVLEMPMYKGDFPDNRFNIRPGYRWDGVDRSNGYEKKYFSMINSKKSMEEEAYRYSTEDM